MSNKAPFTESICNGDIIIGLQSSGPHSNGITLIGNTVEELMSRVDTRALSLLESTLKPTVIYVKAVSELRKHGIEPSYAIHVTGHGWRKVMRAKAKFTYRIKQTPFLNSPTFDPIQKIGNVAIKEMWGNYNMGIGFIFIVKPRDAERTMQICRNAGYTPHNIGVVENGPKRVIIEPAGLKFSERTMKIR